MTRILVTGGAGYVRSVSQRPPSASQPRRRVSTTHDRPQRLGPAARRHLPHPDGRPASAERRPEAILHCAGAPGRRVDRGAGPVLPRQRGRRRRCSGGTDRRHREGRVLVVAARHARHDPDQRTPPPTVSHGGGARSSRTDVYGRAAGFRAVSLPLLRVAGARRARRTDPEPTSSPTSRAGRGRQTLTACDDTRRPTHLHRDHAHVRDLADATCAIEAAPGRPAPTSSRLQPRGRRRVLDPQGHRHRTAVGRRSSSPWDRARTIRRSVASAGRAATCSAHRRIRRSRHGRQRWAWRQRHPDATRTNRRAAGAVRSFAGKALGRRSARCGPRPGRSSPPDHGRSRARPATQPDEHRAEGS